MADQLRISDTGEIEVQPLSWDGEPLWSPDTLREQPGLFSGEAFEQMPGQIATEDASGLYVLKDRMSGELLAAGFTRYVDAFNAARAIGSRAMVVER